jgi:CubicO group peptidase (beta-lactamase class C family)
MLLQEGRWGDKQIVPAAFVHHCRNTSPYNPHFPYSLQFSVNTDGNIHKFPRDVFWKRGSGGHCFYIIPSLDLIVWKLGGRDGQYDAKNTGLPILPEVLQHKESRTGWNATVGDDVAAIETLRMVLDAIVQ